MSSVGADATTTRSMREGRRTYGTTENAEGFSVGRVRVSDCVDFRSGLVDGRVDLVGTVSASTKQDGVRQCCSP